MQSVTGGIHSGVDNYNEALPMLRAALENARPARGWQVASRALNSLGSAYQLLKNWPQAQFYHQQGLPMGRQLGDAVGEASNQTNLARLGLARPGPAPPRARCNGSGPPRRGPAANFEVQVLRERPRPAGPAVGCRNFHHSGKK